jgi:hypothetical protein
MNQKRNKLIFEYKKNIKDGNKKKEIIQMAQENLHMLKRLSEKTSHYNFNKYEKEYDKAQYYKRTHCAFPSIDFYKTQRSNSFGNYAYTSTVKRYCPSTTSNLFNIKSYKKKFEDFHYEDFADIAPKKENKKDDEREKELNKKDNQNELSKDETQKDKNEKNMEKEPENKNESIPKDNKNDNENQNNENKKEEEVKNKEENIEKKNEGNNERTQEEKINKEEVKKEEKEEKEENNNKGEEDKNKEEEKRNRSNCS